MEEFKIIEVTPDMAREWLKHNPNNRSINYKLVSAYSQQMFTNNWDITGQAISFDIDGNLIDGQHRLSAVIMANKPVRMLVATGLRRTYNYDNGKLRSPVEAIYMSTGLRFTRSITAAAGLAIRIIDGKHYTAKITVDEEYKWIMKHKEAIDTLELNNSNYKLLSTAPIILAAISAYEAGITEQQLKGWRKVLNDGIYDMPYQETAVRFRNWWYAKINGSGKTREMQKDIVKAAQNNIQKYARHETVKNILIPEDYIFPIK